MTGFEGWWDGNFLWGTTKGAIMQLENGAIPFLLQHHDHPPLAQTYYETVEALGFDPLAGRHENCHRYNADGCGPGCPVQR